VNVLLFHEDKIFPVLEAVRCLCLISVALFRETLDLCHCANPCHCCL